MNSNIRKRIKGFTLIELIVALSIMTIATVAFIVLMNNSYSHIDAAGKRSVSVHEAKSTIESAMAGKNDANDKSAELTININGIKSITVSGKKKEVQYSSGGTNKKIVVFLPGR